MRKGPVGTDALNAKIQAAVNPARPGKAEMAYRGGVLREGDRVIQLRNDVARRGLVNGDIGYVIEIDPVRHRAFIAFNGARGIEMDREALGMTALAYALTVHKMQGSESRHVIAPITTGHYLMLSRNILYTLLSRGRESCTLVGTVRAVAMAVKRESNSLRATRLKDLLVDGVAAP
jgi:exodeoxyribonuclease V alpha subunit